MKGIGTITILGTYLYFEKQISINTVTHLYLTVPENAFGQNSVQTRLERNHSDNEIHELDPAIRRERVQHVQRRAADNGTIGRDIERDAKDPVCFQRRRVRHNANSFLKGGHLRVRNVICIVTYYVAAENKPTLPPFGFLYSVWIMRSQRSRRRDKGQYYDASICPTCVAHVIYQEQYDA